MLRSVVLDLCETITNKQIDDHLRILLYKILTSINKLKKNRCVYNTPCQAQIDVFTTPHARHKQIYLQHPVLGTNICIYNSPCQAQIYVFTTPRARHKQMYLQHPMLGTNRCIYNTPCQAQIYLFTTPHAWHKQMHLQHPVKISIS